MASDQRDGKVSRREFLRHTATAGAAIGLAGASMVGEARAASSPEPAAAGKTMVGVPFERHERVRIGMVGVGGRGQGLLHNLLPIEGVEIVALCDIVPARVTECQAALKRAGKPAASEYTKGDTDFENLSKRDDVDLVLTATPWDWHVPVGLDAMRNGKHAALEVPAATTLKDCWALVDTSERMRRHCVQLENCCYGSTELTVLTMVRAGLFGELVHGEAAYIHDLRGLLLSDRGEGLWRRVPHMKRNGNLYPTHGLGPVANYMDINRGDRFDYMVSVSSREAGLKAYGKRRLKADDPKLTEQYVCGDVNTSLIRTHLGRTIMLQHDVVSPRPYSRINAIVGTGGAFFDYPPRIYIEARDSNEDWTTLDKYKEFEHPLWRSEGETARKLGGHGGMDFLMCYRLIECMREGRVPEMDVYDAAAWSVPGPLSEASVRRHGTPQKFPDFTRGMWKEKRLSVV